MARAFVDSWPDNTRMEKRLLQVPGTDPGIRSDYYYIAAASRICWRCEKDSGVHGFILPAGFESLSVADEPQDDEWTRIDAPSLICYIDYLLPSAASQMMTHSSHYRLTYSNTTESLYWMNLCEHCDSKLGDHETFCELGQGFEPVSAQQAARIRLTQIDEPFAASVGTYSIGVEFFSHMLR